MKRKILYTTIGCLLPFVGMAQGAIDAYQLSQNDMKGTARYLSMAGAFGALGGDLSSLNQNPAGIGIYRSSDIGLTLDLDLQTTKATCGQTSYGSQNNTAFTCNTAGYVGAYRTNSEFMPNLNWGFSFNRAASFSRKTKGGFSNLQSSLSNYIAGVTNSGGYTDQDIADGYYGYAPWLSVLAYDSYAINPDSQGKNFQGLYGDGTSGNGHFETEESGGINEYSINFGGNILNKLYWGIGFGITDLSYTSNTYYKESLDGAYLMSPEGIRSNGTSDWDLYNQLHTTGTGCNFKMGFIFKPINELRFGFAFHTPTYYSLRDDYYADSYYYYGNGEDGNTGTEAESTWYKIQTPWKFMASVAAVIGQHAIVSFDYQYTGFQTMSVRDDANFEYIDVTNDINNYYRSTNTFKIGAEYRITPQLSVRAGYSHENSPVKEEAMNNQLQIFTSGTIPSYNLVKSTEYYTAGLGYKFNSVYIDMAYVHKKRNSEFHAFSPAIYDGGIEASPTAEVSDNNNQIVLTLGVRF